MLLSWLLLSYRKFAHFVVVVSIVMVYQGQPARPLYTNDYIVVVSTLWIGLVQHHCMLLFLLLLRSSFFVFFGGRKAWLGKDKTIAVAVGAIVDPIIFWITGIGHYNSSPRQKHGNWNTTMHPKTACGLVLDIIDLFLGAEELHDVSQLPCFGNLVGPLDGTLGD